MMAESGNKHVTTTTTTTVGGPPRGGGDGIQLNFGYFKSVPGILKIVHLGLGILCMACGSPAFVSGQHFFLFVSVSAFILSMVWTIIYLLSLRTALNVPVNWLLSELLFLVGTTVSYIIAAIVELASAYGYSSYIAAGVFGLLNTAAYGAAAYLMYTEWKSSGGAVTAPAV